MRGRPGLRTAPANRSGLNLFPQHELQTRPTCPTGGIAIRLRDSLSTRRVARAPSDCAWKLVRTRWRIRCASARTSSKLTGSAPFVSARLAAKNEVLRADAGAERRPLLRSCRAPSALRPAGADVSARSAWRPAPRRARGGRAFEGDQVSAAHRPLERHILRRRRRAHDLELLLDRRMVDHDVKHEAVKLRLEERGYVPSSSIGFAWRTRRTALRADRCAPGS